MKYIKPGEVEKRWQSMEMTLMKPSIKKFEKTASAMDSVARTQILDLKGDNENFNNSFSILMNAFDTFVKEYFHNNNIRGITGDLAHYNSSDPQEMTIMLLWQIRHVDIHGGDIFDETCKVNYENIIKIMAHNNISPVIELPRIIEIGKSFQFSRKDYDQIRSLIFQFIEKRTTKEELQILKIRSSMSDVEITSFKMRGELDGHEYTFEYDDLDKIGKSVVILPNGRFKFKEICVFRDNPDRLIYIEDGTSIPIHFK